MYKTSDKEVYEACLSFGELSFDYEDVLQMIEIKKFLSNVNSNYRYNWRKKMHYAVPAHLGNLRKNGLIYKVENGWRCLTPSELVKKRLKERG